MALDDAYPTSGSTLTTMAQWEAFFTGIAGDGVVAYIDSECVGYLNTAGRTAGVGPGHAQIRGFHVHVASNTPTAVPAASSQNRIDRLVLRLDRTAVNPGDWIKPAIITGTPSSNPQIPALTQTTDGLFDIPIMRWTSEASGALTDLRDERAFLMTQGIEYNGAGRPSPSVRRLGFNRGGILEYADGTAWHTVFEDTGDTALAVVTPSRWENRAPGQWASRLNGMVQVELNLKRIGDDLATDSSDTSNGSVLVQLPSGMRPKRELQLPVTLTAGISARIRYQLDGGVYLNAPSSTVAVGRFVRVTHVFRGA